MSDLIQVEELSVIITKFSSIFWDRIVDTALVGDSQYSWTAPIWLISMA